VFASAAVVALGVVMAVFAVGLGVVVITISARAAGRRRRTRLIRGFAYIFVGPAVAFRLVGLEVLFGVSLGLAIGAFVLPAATSMITPRAKRVEAADRSASVSE
jgi:hypothetical protein